MLFPNTFPPPHPVPTTTLNRQEKRTLEVNVAEASRREMRQLRQQLADSATMSERLQQELQVGAAQRLFCLEELSRATTIQKRPMYRDNTELTDVPRCCGRRTKPC
jgi:hypothetical protein